mgnify:CR=1 FL=1
MTDKNIFDDAIFEYSRDIDVTIMLAANADIAAATTDPQIDFNQGTYLLQIVLDYLLYSFQLLWCLLVPNKQDL